MLGSRELILTTKDIGELQGFYFPLCFSVSSVGFYSKAITSISTNTSFGRRATSTVERAGGEELKYLP